MRRFSELSREDLFQEAIRIRTEGAKKREEGYTSEANMLEKKFYLAVSYLISPEEIIAGETYNILGEDVQIKISYLNGIFGWGEPIGQEEGELVAYPIGQLYQDRKRTLELYAGGPTLVVNFFD